MNITKRTASMILGTLLVFAGAFVAYYASQAKGASRHDLGPSFFPKMVGIGLSLLGVYTVVYEFFRGDRTVLRLIDGKFAVGVAAMAAYTALLMPLGYVVSGMLVAAVLMILMCDRPLRETWPLLTLVGVLAPLAIYFIFAKYLLVPLPTLLS